MILPSKPNLSTKTVRKNHPRPHPGVPSLRPVEAPARAESDTGEENRSFTLIELLVVVAVIAILFAMLMPALGIAREKTRRIKCGSQLRYVGMALRSYANDNEAWFPNENNSPGLIKLLEDEWLKSNTVFLCPSTTTEQLGPTGLDDTHLDYVYKGGTTEKSAGVSTGLMADRITTPNHEEFGNVVFGDGHIEGFRGEDWSELNSFHNSGEWPNDPH